MLRQALNIAPANTEARLAALRAALDAKRDALSLAIYRGFVSATKDAEIAERLAEAAERLSEPAEEQQFLRTAIDLRPKNDRATLESKLKAIEAEQSRRAANAARQPVIKNVPDQDVIVRPHLARSTP